MSPFVLLWYMAPLSSLDAARAIRQQFDAGLLDLSVINRQLWPVAVIQLLIPSSLASTSHRQCGTDISVEDIEELEQARRDDLTTSTATSRAIARATPEGTVQSHGGNDLIVDDHMLTVQPDNTVSLLSDVPTDPPVTIPSRENERSATRAQAARGKEKAAVTPVCTRSRQKQLSLLSRDPSNNEAAGGPSAGPAYPPSLASSTNQRQRRAPTNRKRKLSLRQAAENDIHKRSNSAAGSTNISKDRTQSEKQIRDASETSPLLAWATEFPTFTEWHLLNDFKIIGTRQGQNPFEELGLILQRIQRIGTPKVQSAFARSVRAWISSPHFTHQAIATPSHLESITDFEDVIPFQKFWKASEIAKNAKGFEDMAVLIHRKSLIDLMTAYHEVIAYVRAASARGEIILRPGQRAGARAKDILYNIMYPNAEEQKRHEMRRYFNYQQQCATPYVRLQKQYHSVGILAMIPIKLNEMEFRSTDACFLSFQAVIEIMKPELRGSRLHFCGEIIESIAEGRTLEIEALQELALWTDSALLLNNAHLLSSSTSLNNKMIDNDSERRAAEPEPQVLVPGT